MNTSNLFLSFIMSINAVSCSAMLTNNEHNKYDKKTISALFKIIYKDEPAEAKQRKNFYETIINNFNRHATELRNEIHLAQTDSSHIDRIRSIIITDDLIPLQYKINNILKCMNMHKLYRINHRDQRDKTPESSPRITIITSIINRLKDPHSFPLDDETITNYQLLINHVTHFSIEDDHDEITINENNWAHEKNDLILKALKAISLPNENEAQNLAISLNGETLHKKKLEKLKTGEL